MQLISRSRDAALPWLFGCLVFGACTERQPPTVAQPLNAENVNQFHDGWEEFVSEDPAFTIRYPDGWQAWQKDRMLTIEPPTRDAAITVNVPNTNKPLDEAAAIAIQAALQDATPVSERESFIVEGIRGLAQEFEREGESGRKRWLTVFLLGEGRIAAITANAPPDVVLREREHFDKIMRSFRFAKQQTAP